MKNFKIKHNEPVFSIIIPVHNVEKYIPECMLSVLSQSFDSYEIICIDDASTDSSMQVLKTYENDKRVTILSNKDNVGVGAARNKAVRIARGKYIVFVDGDDLLDKEALCILNEKLYNNPDAII